MNKIRSFKHRSYNDIVKEFYSLYPEFIDQVKDCGKHSWTKNRRGVLVNLKNGTRIVFEVMNFPQYDDSDKPAWSSFRALLIPADIELMEEKK